MAFWGAKTIRLEKAAEGVVDRASKKYERFEDAFFGLRWLLARKASLLGLARHNSEGGTEVRVYAQAGDEVANTPDIWVLFSIEPNEVVILDVVVAKRSEITD